MPISWCVATLRGVSPPRAETPIPRPSRTLARCRRWSAKWCGIAILGAILNLGGLLPTPALATTTLADPPTPPAPRDPPTIYAFDGDLGDDATLDASPDRPARSMARVKQIALARGGFRPGDEVWRAGRTTESVDVGSVSGVTHRPWPGRESGAWRGTVAVPPSLWLNDGTPTYKAFIGPNRNLFICVDRWASRVDAHGRHYGYLKRDPVRPDFEGLPTPGTWNYDAPTGALTVRLIDDADPRTLSGDDAVMWTDGTLWSGLYSQFGTDTVVSGVNAQDINGGSFRQFLAGGTVPCYGLTVCGTNSVVRDLRMDDCSIHHLSILSGSTRNVLVENVACWGGGLYSGASQFVVYTGNSNIEGIVFRNCSAHPYALLDSLGQPLRFNSNWAPLNAPVTIDGFYAHTLRTNGTRITDMLWDRCTATFYGDSVATTSRGTAFNAGDTAPPPKNPFNWAGYGARGDRCRIFHASADDLYGNIAFRNRFADFTNAKSGTLPWCGSINAGTTVLFESCVFVVNGDGALRRSLYHLFAGARLLMVNCTIIDLGTAPGSHEIFSTADRDAYNPTTRDGFNVNAIGCLFYFHRPAGSPDVPRRLFAGDAGAPDSNVRFDGCAYFNVSSFSDDASRNDAAEWKRLDPRGLFGLDPKLVDPTSVDPLVAGQLRADSPLRKPAYRRMNSVRPETGYNETLYDGTIGAWQGQIPPARLP